MEIKKKKKQNFIKVENSKPKLHMNSPTQNLLYSPNFRIVIKDPGENWAFISVKAGAVEVLTHLREINIRPSSLADKTAQKEKKTKIESGASYNRNQSARGMQHGRVAHCLSKTTVSATFHSGVHIQMFVTLQLQPAWAATQEWAHACWLC